MSLSLVFGLVASHGLLLYLLTHTYFADKNQLLDDLNRDRAIQLSETVSQVMTQHRQGTYVVAKDLISKFKLESSITKMVTTSTTPFVKPFDALIAIAIKNPYTPQLAMLTAVNPRFKGKVLWTDDDWKKVFAKISLKSISSEKLHLMRIQHSSGDLFALTYPILLEEGKSGVVTSILWGNDFLRPFRILQTHESTSYVIGLDGQVLIPPWKGVDANFKVPAHVMDIVSGEETTGARGGPGMNLEAVRMGFQRVPTLEAMVISETGLQDARLSYRKMIYIISAGFCGLLILSLVFGRWIAYQVTQPLSQITRFASEMAKGHFGTSVHSSSSGEVGELVKSVNQMGEELYLREQKILQAGQQLVHSGKLSAMEQFGSGLAHELKNPITGILGQLHLLLGKPEILGDSTAVDSLKKIELEARKSQSIVESFSQFIRRSHMVMQEQDFHAVIEGTLKLAEPQLGIHNIRVVRNLMKKSPHILCQPHYVQQVILSLLINAKEAMPKGGSIQIATDTEGGFAKVMIRDTGEGISPENLKHVFEPLFSTKKLKEGLGLGLAVAQEIMNDHKGRIDIQSNLGEGTVVTLFFPLPNEKELSKAQQKTQRKTALRAQEATQEIVQNQVIRLSEPTREITAAIRPVKTSPAVVPPVEPHKPLSFIPQIPIPQAFGTRQESPNMGPEKESNPPPDPVVVIPFQKPRQSESTRIVSQESPGGFVSLDAVVSALNAGTSAEPIYDEGKPLKPVQVRPPPPPVLEFHFRRPRRQQDIIDQTLNQVAEGYNPPLRRPLKK